jgi:hypothetical protein
MWPKRAKRARRVLPKADLIDKNPITCSGKMKGKSPQTVEKP